MNVHRSGSHQRTTLSAEELPQFAGVASAPSLSDDGGQRPLLPALVGHADHGGLQHGGVAR